MRDCRNCGFYDGFINFTCSGCKVFLHAINKTITFRDEMKEVPSQDALNHFKQLWSEVR